MRRFVDKIKKSNNVKRAYDYLTQVKKIEPHIAAGIIGNLMVESSESLDVEAFNPNDLGKTSFGLAQWRGSRLEDLKKFAGDKINNIETQLDFLVHELNTTHKQASKLLQETTNAEDAALVFSKKFEKPHKDFAKNDIRASKAKEVFLLMNDDNIYVQDKKGNIQVLNPKIATELDKKNSPIFKRKFYKEVFNIDFDQEAEDSAETEEEVDNTPLVGKFLTKLFNAANKTKTTESSSPSAIQTE